VKLVLEEGPPAAEAARRVSISKKTLGQLGSLRPASAKRGELGKNQKPLTELERERARVKRELAEMKMERDL